MAAGRPDTHAISETSAEELVGPLRDSGQRGPFLVRHPPRLWFQILCPPQVPHPWL